jgi:glyoxylase-like metal-dependent hydrolase (beta-lactamase superfamily II)
VKQWAIGRVRITRVVESEGPTRVTFLFKHATPADVLAQGWLRPHFADGDGNLLAAVHALVIDTGTRRIVVDTCVGNHKVRANRAWNQLQGRFLEDLAAAGYPRESVDTVLCTHLHVDHVGWNTMLVDGRWVPTFPNARYLFARDEWNYWSQQTDVSFGDVMGDSVRPVVDAGQADLVETNHRLADGLWLEPTLGHTPGHVSVRIQSDGADAVITGDLMHHPIQCALPDWSNSFDYDSAAARVTRRSFLARYANSDVLVLGTHFATPTAGHIVRHEGAYRFAVGEG